MTDPTQIPEPHFIRKHCISCEHHTTQKVFFQYSEETRLMSANYCCTKCETTANYRWFSPIPQDIIDEQKDT